MILLSIGLILLAIFGAPLFTVIAASAMLGYYGEGIDLMAISIEVLGIASMPKMQGGAGAAGHASPKPSPSPSA